jgi:DnaK suppressor protein
MPVFVLNKDFFATTCSEKCKENLQLKKLICKKEEIKREIIDLESSVRKTLLDESANATISNHPADQSKLPNYNLDHILPTKRKLLIQYESAIEMHKAGTYGICEDCGEDIDPARLEVSPCASRCFNCKTELEEKGKISCGCGTKVPANRLRNSVCL